MQPRQFILGLALAIPAIWVLIAPRSKEAIPPKDAVVVEYWEKWTGLEALQMKEVVDEYNATVGKDKGIFVRYVSMSGIAQKMLVSTAGGAPPDIAGIWSDQIPQFSTQNTFYPLDDLSKEYGFTPQSYKRPYAEMCRYDGKQWAMISSCAAIIMQYNRMIFWQNADLLRAKGLDPTRGPETIEELDRYAQALDVFDPKDRISPLKRAGYLPMEPGWYVPFTGLWFGNENYNDQTDKFQLDAPAAVAAFKWIEGYSKRLGPAVATNFSSGFGGYATAGNPFLIGKVAMIQQGPWLALYLENYTPEVNRVILPRNLEVFLPRTMRSCNYSWVVQPFPAVSKELKNTTLAPFDALCIPNGAKHKREAFDFIAFVNRQDIMEKLSRRRWLNSPFPKVSRDFLAFHPNPYIDVFEQVASSPNAHHEPKTPVSREVLNDCNALISSIVQLNVDVEKGLKQLQADATKKLGIYESKAAARKQQEKP